MSLYSIITLVKYTVVKCTLVKFYIDDVVINQTLTFCCSTAPETCGLGPLPRQPLPLLGSILLAI